MKKENLYSLILAVLLIPAVLLGLGGCAGREQSIEALMTETAAGTEQQSSETKAETSGGAEAGNGTQVSEASDAAETADAPQAIWYVHVCGAVKTPGVYAVTAQSRGFEAVAAAGGFSEEAAEDYVNLAEPLQDGIRIEIPTRQQVAEAMSAKGADSVLSSAGYSTGTVQNTTGGAGSSAGAGSSGDHTGDTQPLVNINTADQTTLCTLPGVGESRALSIIAYRTEHGDFQSCEEIKAVTGIKDGLYSKIKDRICVK